MAKIKNPDNVYLLYVVLVVLAVLGGICTGVLTDLNWIKISVSVLLLVFGGSWIVKVFGGKQNYLQRSLGVQLPPNVADFVGAILFFFGLTFGVTSLVVWIFS